MKILHYALGFPPYRSGGLTKYCIDLMLAQKKRGYEIAMMWPGKFSLTGHFVRLKKGINQINDNGAIIPVTSYEIINPLPVPLDEGIKDINLFMEKCVNPQVFTKFLGEYKPDAIHLHTLMGLHKEFLEAAKELGIKIIFTSHDYFGICPKVTLFQNGQICSGDCSLCYKCNESALSIKKIKIIQSGLYRYLKDSEFVKYLRKKHRRKFFENRIEDTAISEDENQISQSETVTKEDPQINILEQTHTQDYMKLRAFYMEMLEMVDCIHFNSTVTESVYRRFIPERIQGKVINISHGNINDHRKMKCFEGKLKITYLAPAKPFKGYSIMKQALDELWREGIVDFELNLYNGATELSTYMKLHDSFVYDDLEDIFDKTDVLIAPSVWHETFGFTVLEALSFGTPVIVTTNVGAKDILEDAKYGMVIKPTKEAVKQAVKYLVEHREILKEYNRRIVEEMNLSKVINCVDSINELY